MSMYFIHMITWLSHDPSEIILVFWFGAQETFIIIIVNVENPA